MRTRSVKQLSGGERRRIALGLALAFGDLAAARGRLQCNLMVLDEVGGSPLPIPPQCKPLFVPAHACGKMRRIRSCKHMCTCIHAAALTLPRATSMLWSCSICIMVGSKLPAICCQRGALLEQLIGWFAERACGVPPGYCILDKDGQSPPQELSCSCCQPPCTFRGCTSMQLKRNAQDGSAMLKTPLCNLQHRVRLLPMRCCRDVLRCCSSWTGRGARVCAPRSRPCLRPACLWLRKQNPTPHK